jgi:hypothetical protein
MPLYYFDFKDGVPVRDRIGHECASDQEAVAKGSLLAERIGAEQPDLVGDGYISVVNENGEEIYRAPVTRPGQTPGATLQ